MTIIELNETQFSNYAKIHSVRNYQQTVEYGNMMSNHEYNKLFLGLSDESNNIHAACLVLLKSNYGIIPNGYLISNNDYILLETFSMELINYFKNKKIIYLRLNPLTIHKKYDKEYNVTFENKELLENYTKLGYKYYNNPEKVTIFNSKDNINDTFNDLSSKLKTNINKAYNMSINIYKGNSNNIELFSNLVNDNNINDYKDYFNYFNTTNNKVELYFSKIDSKKYLNNFRYLLNQEQENNWKLQEMMEDPKIEKTEELVSKKMLSDKLVNSYNNEVLRATRLFKLYPKGLVIGANLIIKNNKEIYFIKEGYEKNFHALFNSSIIKWEIIKKYINKGYTTFNLGNLNGTTKNDYFDGTITEYPGDFDLIINKYAYKLNNSINKIKIVKK